MERIEFLNFRGRSVNYGGSYGFCRVLDVDLDEDLGVNLDMDLRRMGLCGF